MNLFKKCESPLQNIAFMALMSAINVIFALLTTFVPILFLILIFVLPLTSVLVTIFCKKRYFVIYAFATVALCLGATFWDISNTFFYIIPSIISGFLFGVLAMKKSPSIFLIIVPAFIQVAFTYIAVPIIELMLNINIISTFINAFGLQNNPNVELVIPSFIFLLSLIQSALYYMIIKDELPKFKIVLEQNNKFYYLIIVGVFVFLIAMGSIAPFYMDWSYLALMCSLYFAIYMVVDFWNYKKMWLHIASGISLVITFFLFASLYSIVGKQYGFLLLGIFPFLIGVIAICNMCLSKHRNKDTINAKDKLNG